MATMKRYTVRRAGFASQKGGGVVYITRQNEDQIPHLLSAALIRDRVQSGAFEEHDTGIEDTTPADIEAAALLESKADGAPRSKKKGS